MPPAQDPVEVIEISSDDDSEDGDMLSRLRANRVKLMNIADKPMRRRSGDFASFVQDAFPVYLLSTDITRLLTETMTMRLEAAAAAGISLEGLYVDQDGLITWSRRQVLDEEGDLHGLLQQGLRDHQLSLDIGPMLKQHLVATGKARLRTAQDEGITVDQLRFEDCLLTWRTDLEELSSLPIDRFAASGDPPEYTSAIVLSDPRGRDPAESRQDLGRKAWASWLAKTTYCPDDSSDSDSDGEDGDGDDADMGNEDVLVGHLVHDVDIVGDEGQVQTVDVEVYVVEGEDEDLGQMEYEVGIGVDALPGGMEEAMDIEVEMQELVG